MNRQYVVAAIFLGIAACATSGPESPVLGAKVDTEMTTIDPTASDGVIEMLDAPAVPMVANVSGEADNPDKNALVCRREKSTGSHRVTRVCRTRAEIERRRAEDQNAFNDIRSKPVGPAVGRRPTPVRPGMRE